MPTSSLPIDINALTQPITVEFAPTNGIKIIFGQNEGNDFVVAPFFGQMHWVPSGHTHALLPSFQPTTDSIILEPLVISRPLWSTNGEGLNLPICQPFPKYFTFENVDATSVLQQILTFRKGMFPKFSQPEIDRFFDGIGDYGITLGDGIGSASSVLKVNDRFYRKGNYVKIDNEVMKIHSANGNFHGVTRGELGTTITAHLAGAKVLFVKSFSVPVDEAGTRLGRAGVQAGGANFVVRTWDKHPVRCPNGRELVYTHIYMHHLRFCEPTIPVHNVLYDALPYGLSGSVGSGGGNVPHDVLMVKHRLRDLGFSVRPTPTFPVMTIDSTADAILGDIISLFRSIIAGNETIQQNFKRIDHRSIAEEWIWAQNAPQWQKLETNISRGYENIDRANNENNIPLNQNINGTLTPPINNVYSRNGNGGLEHDWGTNYLISAIKDAGIYYLANDDDLAENCHLNNLVIRTNDASFRGGGNTPDHLGHETGLMVDVAFANRDGYSPGGITITTSPPTFASYYQDYAYLVVRSFASVDAVVKILMRKVNPTDLADVTKAIHDSSTKTDGSYVHANHSHIEVKPPSEASPWDVNLETHF